MHQHQHQQSQQPQQQHQTQPKHNEHWQINTNNTAAATTCTAEYSLPFNQQETPQLQQHRHHHMPRKHSHSPHPSRHTSPHSRHTSPHSRHTSPHSRHTSPHSRHTSPHSRHTSPHSRHTSPHSRHTSPHSRHTSPHSRHTSPHAHGHSHGHGHSHTSPHQSHHHMHDHEHQNGTDNVDTFTRNIAPRASVRSTSSHVHAHHHSHNHRRRKRSNNNHGPHQHTNGGGSGGGGAGAAATGTMDRNQNGHHHSGHAAGHTCTRRHRSVTDVSNTSLNTCNDPLCPEREIQEIFVHKSSMAAACCSSSRTELAQYFAEDLYGSSSRRPSSCCTSSDYCYQTDSTSLYGSRSSLSRNNSVKSASVTMRKKKQQQRQPSYSSISLRALNASRPNSQTGSLTSIFDRAKQYAANGDASKPHADSPSKVTIERHTSKDALSNDLPEYACSPSPIRWSFLADGKTAADIDSNAGATSAVAEDTRQYRHNGAKSHDELRSEHRQEMRPPHHREQRSAEEGHPPKPIAKPPRSHSRHQWKTRSSSDDRPSTSRKCCESPCKYEESTMVQFHQAAAEQFNNCCSNYIQCNTYLDQDLQITSEDIHQYLSKGQQEQGSILNNTKTYPFQPSNALEFQYKNNFANNNTATNTLSSVEGTESMRSYDPRFRRNSSKETNLNQNPLTESCIGEGACAMSSSCSSTPMSAANINLSSSTNNINIVFSSSMERNANEVKFINTTSRTATGVVSTEAHHSAYLPYSYPTYDYTNMAANSQFNKPIGIDEIPQEMTNRGDDMMTTTTTSSSQHSSSLQSPEPQQQDSPHFSPYFGRKYVVVQKSLDK